MDPHLRAGRLASLVAAAALAAAVLAAAGLAAASGTPALSRPERIYVVDFAATPAKVKLQRGIGSRLVKALEGSAARKAEHAKAAAEVINAVSDTLVREIRALGIPAERVAPGAVPPGTAPSAIVSGRVTAIDEGNRTARTVVGFGAGASRVEADAELAYRDRGGTKVLISFGDTGKSRKTPGLAVTMGAGAAIGAAKAAAVIGVGLHAYSEVRGSTVAADGERLAKDLARQLGRSFAALGWVPPPAH